MTIAITDADGEPLNNNETFRKNLKQIGILSADNVLKVELGERTYLKIIISETHTCIFAGFYDHELKDKNKRPEIYHFFYYQEETEKTDGHLIYILKDYFIKEAEEERKKYMNVQKEMPESLFCFRDIRNAVDNYNSALSSNILLDEKTRLYLKQGETPEFKAKSIQQGISCLINYLTSLDPKIDSKNKSTYLLEIFHKSIKFSGSTGAINIFVDKKHNGIPEPVGDFKKFVNNYERKAKEKEGKARKKEEKAKKKEAEKKGEEVKKKAKEARKKEEGAEEKEAEKKGEEVKKKAKEARKKEEGAEEKEAKEKGEEVKKKAKEAKEKEAEKKEEESKKKKLIKAAGLIAIIALLFVGVLAGYLGLLWDMNNGGSGEKGDGTVYPPPNNNSCTNSIGIEFVRIPAGEFMMGSNKGIGNEMPNHSVKLGEDFCMGKYEVTQKQWREVMGNNPSIFKGDDLPVENVSWNDAQEFIKKLNEKEGIDKYRLPSEAEWEYAARAGTTTRYSFGDDESKLSDYAWYIANSDYKTHEVGQKEHDLRGLYDMHGNVWEWVQDIYHSSYNGAPTDGSAWEGDGSKRVNRGCSWNILANYCRSAFRNSLPPGDHGSDIGFRLVRDL